MTSANAKTIDGSQEPAAAIPNIDAEHLMYLARIEAGKVIAVYPIDHRQVRMPRAQWNKERAKILNRRPRAWRFRADRSGIVAKLSKPGVAAVARTSPEAIAAAMKLWSEYASAIDRARNRRG